MNLKKAIVITINPHRINNTTRAYAGLRKPKNMTDHTTFSTSCTPNATKLQTKYLLLRPLIITKYNAIPIKTKRMVHTGPNNQPGGVNQGLLSNGYQDVTLEKVKKAPIPPAN
jgi:hypothetical protein